jgi:isoleucyl-tRNA synthetase
VIAALAESGNLFARGMTTIRDAHSWRSKGACHPPGDAAVVHLDGHTRPERQDRCVRTALKAIDETEFFPRLLAATRLRSMVEGRPDWLDLAPTQLGRADHHLQSTSPASRTRQRLPKDKADELNANDHRTAIAKGGVEAWFDTPAKKTFLDAPSACRSR